MKFELLSNKYRYAAIFVSVLMFGLSLEFAIFAEKQSILSFFIGVAGILVSIVLFNWGNKTNLNTGNHTDKEF